MTEFTGRVAVVTVAASGIGRALADRCTREGMRVVLADAVFDGLRAGGGRARRDNLTTPRRAHVAHATSRWVDWVRPQTWPA